MDIARNEQAIRGSDSPESTGASVSLDFRDVYEKTIDFVYSTLRRLGLEGAAIDDAVQDVYVVVHRRLDEFRGDSSLRTWIYGIALHVARTHRRTRRRSTLHGVLTYVEGEELPDNACPPAHQPDRRAEVADDWRRLLRILDRLDDDKREIFVLAELEGFRVPEIAELLQLKLNTAYSRLRLAREAFEEAFEHDREIEHDQARTLR